MYNKNYKDYISYNAQKLQYLCLNLTHIEYAQGKL